MKKPSRMPWATSVLSLSLLMLLAFALSSFADPSFVGVTDWNAGDWAEVGDADNVVGGTTLLTTFNAAGVPTMEGGTLSTISASLIGDGDFDFAPNWLSVTFDFQGYASSAQSLYFESDGGAERWSYTFTSLSHAFETESISFQSSAGWTQLAGSQTFSDALAAVTRIGVEVEHMNAGTALEYGLDNWQFFNNQYVPGVPEPGTWATICAALIPAAFFMRRELRKRQLATVQA